jgi:hypothetical protein
MPALPVPFSLGTAAASAVHLQARQDVARHDRHAARRVFDPPDRNIMIVARTGRLLSSLTSMRLFRSPKARTTKRFIPGIGPGGAEDNEVGGIDG